MALKRSKHKRKRQQVLSEPQTLNDRQLKTMVSDISSGVRLGWPQLDGLPHVVEDFYAVLALSSVNRIGDSLKCPECKVDFVITPTPASICVDAALHDVGVVVTGRCPQCSGKFAVALPARVVDMSLTSFMESCLSE